MKCWLWLDFCLVRLGLLGEARPTERAPELSGIVGEPHQDRLVRGGFDLYARLKITERGEPSDFPWQNSAQMGEFRVVMDALRENRGRCEFSIIAYAPFDFSEALIFRK